ncbi:MAG: regulator, partial [Acidobacteria bacterium]
MAVSTQEFKILVADDSPLYRKLVEETLAHEQYTVCFGKNGREASDLLAVHQPALVITDWEMPDITGIELCGHIRRDQAS